MEKHLLIFVKNPQLGKVKTRLAKDIGEQAALMVYRDLMDLCRVQALRVNAKRHLYYAFEIDEKDDWRREYFQKQLQQEGGLGLKMKMAFSEVFENKGPQKVIIIGSDCYDLTSAIIEEAFEQLDTKDLVIGPANDGGYYLLGMKHFYPFLFEGIDWSTEKVLLQTLTKAKQHNLSVSKLIELVDLDTIEDLKKSGYKNQELAANDRSIE